MRFAFGVTVAVGQAWERSEADPVCKRCYHVRYALNAEQTNKMMCA